MKKKIIIFLGIIVLLLEQVSCTEYIDLKNSIDKESGSRNSSMQQAGLDELSMELCNLQSSDIMVYAGSTAHSFQGGKVYVTADDKNKKEMIELLNTIDLSCFSINNDTNIIGASVILKLQDAKSSRYLRLISGNNILYLQYTNTQNITTVFAGKAGGFSISELENVQNEILGDTMDTVDVGILLWEGEESTINKGVSAIVKNILDGSIDVSYEKQDSCVFNNYFEISINDCVYKVEIETGMFSKSFQKNIEYGKLDSQWLTQICNLLAIL